MGIWIAILLFIICIIILVITVSCLIMGAESEKEFRESVVGKKYLPGDN